MPSLDTIAQAPFVKMMYIGDSGSGKTGSLLSLAQAGYRLRILDMDNNIQSLAMLAREAGGDVAKSISVVSYRDRVKMGTDGPAVSGKAEAFTNAMAALSKWPDDGSTPSEWGHPYVFVLDTMTALGDAAYLWAKSMGVGAGSRGTERRAIFFSAQEAITTVMSRLFSDEFRAHVIVISHVTHIEMGETDGESVEWKGFPSTIGKSLSRSIARFSPSLIMAESKTVPGKGVRRTIRTLPTPNIDLKNPVPFRLAGDNLPLESGLATIFAAIKGT